MATIHHLADRQWLASRPALRDKPATVHKIPSQLNQQLGGLASKLYFCDRDWPRTFLAWEPVAFRVPEFGEWFVGIPGISMAERAGLSEYQPRLIVRPIL